MAEGSERSQYHIWIDPDGQVWIEDPDRGAVPLASALQPDFAFGATQLLLPPALIGRTRRIAAPEPWPVDLPGLWALHDALLRAEPAPDEAPLPPRSLLDLKRHIAGQLARACVFCEHRCGVDRLSGERGICKVGATSYVGEHYLHEAEEREIAPSFVLALTGCSWHCVYCHTASLINRVDHGLPLVPAEFARLHAEAMRPEVRTVSFVGGNPDHHLLAILDWLAASPAGFDKPLVWNSNMYGSPELYQLLDGVVDVYLGDLRYGNDGCARALSGIDRYWEAATRNWKLSAEQAALLIVRLLVLPGHLDCCFRPMADWLAAELPQARISVLDQFHPTYLTAKQAPALDRVLTPEERAAARELIDARGLTRVEEA
jgi:putative pyruvate formate lyase activating enzyme